jgi:hypothetical protein
MLNKLRGIFPNTMNRVVSNGKSYIDPAAEIARLNEHVKFLNEQIDGTRSLVGDFSKALEAERLKSKDEYRRGFEDGAASVTGNNALAEGAL